MLNSMLEIQPKTLYRGQEFEEEIQDTSDTIECCISLFEESLRIVENAEFEVKDYFGKIKLEIDLEVETAIDSINKYRDQLFKEVEGYQEKCLTNFNENLIKDFADCDQNLKEAKQSLEYVNDSGCIETKVKLLHAKYYSLFKIMKHKLKNFDEKLFCHTEYYFDRYDEIGCKYRIGTLYADFCYDINDSNSESDEIHSEIDRSSYSGKKTAY
jgi:hypothetical protein